MLVDHAETELRVREVLIPVFVVRPLTRVARAEQVDHAKLADFIAEHLALDAIVEGAPCAICVRTRGAQHTLSVSFCGCACPRFRVASPFAFARSARTFSLVDDVQIDDDATRRNADIRKINLVRGCGRLRLDA